MDYEKKYRDLVEAVKELQEANPSDNGIQKWVKDNIPELKESKDERIRKELLDYLIWLRDFRDSGYSPSGKYDIHEMITWLELEKQSKASSFIKWHPVTEEPEEAQELLCELAGSDNFTWHEIAFYHAHNKTYWDGERLVENVIRWCYLDDLEKQGEQILANSAKICKDEHKPADEVKPKFKVGDWITDGNITIQIEAVKNGCYLYCGDCALYSIKTADKVYHLWTIQDAKDGDVLVDSCKYFNNPFIFILKRFEKVDFGLATLSNFSSYCYLTMSDNQKFKDGGYHHMHDIRPATKEQRDTLMKAMADAGYEWDTNKKELKKIEQKPWSEEDETMIESIIDYMKPMPILFESTTGKSGKEYTKKFIKSAIKWLKSLKERYIWKPSKEQIDAFEHFVRSIGESGYASPYDNNTKLLHSLLSDLKKLKD